MNIENMKKLLEQLKSERNPVAFDMLNWFQHNGSPLYGRTEILNTVKTHACGTVACLAGQAALLAYGERSPITGTVSDVAAVWLGLNATEEHELFFGWWEGWEETCEFGDEDPDLSLLTLDMAIVEVSRLIKKAEAA